MPRKAANAEKKSRNGQRIASSSKNPLEKLRPKAQKYAIAKASGMTSKAAAATAGVSTRMGMNYEQQADVQAAYRDLVRKAMPMAEVAKLIQGGAHATAPVFGPDGRKKSDRPDWKTRRAYIEMASEHSGYHEKKADQGNTVISVVVEHVGNKINASTRSQPTITATTEAI